MVKLEKPLVINLFAGPGTGKSTTAAQLFSLLKWQGFPCELVTEFAKEKVWEESFKTLDDQIYVFGKQLHKMRRLVGKVDIIITDSPLLFSIIYDQSANIYFQHLVQDIHNEFNNFNIFLKRKKKYVEAGRTQNEEDAKKLDDAIHQMLTVMKEDYYSFDATEAVVKENILSVIIGTYNQLTGVQV